MRFSLKKALRQPVCGTALLGLCVLTFSAPSCKSETSQSPAVELNESSLATPQVQSADELKDVMRRGSIDDVVAALNDAKRVQHQKDLITFIETLWRNDLSLEKGMRSKVDSDLVRVHIADTLLQASANKFTEIDTAPILAYVRTLVSNGDKEVAIAAVGALASSPEPTDVEILNGALHDSRDGVFRAAALSLAFMCSDAASKAVDDAISSARATDRRTFLEQTRKEAMTHKQITGACR